MPFSSSTVSSLQLCTPPAVGLRALRPRVVAELAFVRNAVEDPLELAGDDVVRLHVARRRRVARALRRQRHDHQVARSRGRDCSCAAAAPRRCSSPRPRGPSRKSTRPSLPKVVIVCARARVQRRQHARIQIEQAAIAAVGALPIVDAARRHGPFVRMRPELAAGGRVERDDLVVAREHVHHVVDDDRD